MEITISHKMASLYYLKGKESVATFESQWQGSKFNNKCATSEYRVYTITHSGAAN